MTCCQCQGLEMIFDDKNAVKELDEYRQKGPDKTTRVLLDALKAEGIEGMTLLDIGGGVGAIQHELLKTGARSATDVDASAAYLKAAQDEAEQQGHADRVIYRHGDFVDLAPDLSPADIVTLDRVICCYHDVQALVGLSSRLADKLYGVVYPRDTWWVKAGTVIGNFVLWVLRKPYRFFAHSTEIVDALVRGSGLEQRFYRKTFLWQVVVYKR